ncbi:AEC family transporter [Pelosinus sp. UFO1]|uniref:AEC family transporter n=1 Tax=Pelosinus sp. UFO1 TaxID=484770 RepID=UPI0004D1A3D4|nr:AEC family transporter [Pelosinus sp. UFO1]AIF49677.1 Auxin Efflux Carrier [Pelosinus sp. UFO1]
MNNGNDQFLLSMVIIILGYLLRKINLIKEQDGETLSRIIFNISLPALIITTFNTITIDFSLILITIIGIVYGIFMALLGVIVFKNEDRATRGMLSMLVPSFNIGLFAYPIVEAIWGQEGIKYFGMFDVGNSLVIFGVSYIIAGYFSSDSSDLNFTSVFSKLLKSVPLLSYTIAFGLAALGVHFPRIVVDCTQVLARANMPLSLLLLGVYLNFSIESKYLKNMAKVLALRYLVGLTVGTIFFSLMPFDRMFKYTMLIGFLLPMPTAVIQYAIEFDYDQKFVGTVTNITILLSFFLIWIIISMPNMLRP